MSIDIAAKPFWAVAVSGETRESARRPATMGRIRSLNILPLSASALLRRNRRAHKIRMGTVTTDRVETADPGIPACWYPTNVAALIAMGPGVTWERASTWLNWDSVSHPVAFTSWYSIRGSVESPPPKAKR